MRDSPPLPLLYVSLVLAAAFLLAPPASAQTASFSVWDVQTTQVHPVWHDARLGNVHGSALQVTTGSANFGGEWAAHGYGAGYAPSSHYDGYGYQGDAYHHRPARVGVSCWDVWYDPWFHYWPACDPYGFGFVPVAPVWWAYYPAYRPIRHRTGFSFSFSFGYGAWWAPPLWIDPWWGWAPATFVYVHPVHRHRARYAYHRGPRTIYVRSPEVWVVRPPPTRVVRTPAPRAGFGEFKEDPRGATARPAQPRRAVPASSTGRAATPAPPPDVRTRLGARGNERPATAAPGREGQRPATATPSRGSDRPAAGAPSRGSERPSTAAPNRGSDRPSTATPNRGSDRPSTAAPARGGTRPGTAAPTNDRPSTSPPARERPATTRPGPDPRPTAPPRALERTTGPTTAPAAPTRNARPASPPAASNRNVRPTSPPAASNRNVRPQAPPAASNRNVRPQSRPAASNRNVRPQAPPAASNRNVRPQSRPAASRGTARPQSRPSTSRPSAPARTSRPARPPRGGGLI